MSTQAYIRQRRLEAVHRALLGAEPTTAKVNTIAPEFGFFEIGRLAVDYRKRFHELPSETLRRRRLSSFVVPEAGLEPAQACA